MSQGVLTKRLRAAAAHMDRVIGVLTAASPEALEGCAGLIDLACREIRAVAVPPGAAKGDTAALAEAQRLRNRIGSARRLLENAYQFHARWGQILGARTGGYVAGGQAAPFRAASRLWLRG